MAHPIIRFHGSAGTVTGSCFAIETDLSLVVVDCGLFQGSKTEKELNYRALPFDVRDIDAVVLTHAHIDHSGLLPKLSKQGYTGSIFATSATADLCGVMLPDSGHIQEVEVDQRNRRSRRRASEQVEPIYTAADAYEMLHQFRPIGFEVWQSAAPDIRFRFWNAGHLLGSASIEMEIGREKPTRVLFSGDIGPENKLFQQGPSAPQGWDYVICESTYGDRDRIDATPEARRKVLANEVEMAARYLDGALIIPSFAVERTQELLADLTLLMEQSAIGTVPIFIDSPLATKASEVFFAHKSELYQGEVLARAMRSNRVKFTESAEQSKALDRVHGFHVVIAASGMCEAGRIRHRLKNWLWRDEGTVLLVGYQASGTLGRILADGASTVRIQGEEIAVRARIRSIDAYSGHADGPELERWLRARLPVTKGVFLVHGETEALQAMRDRADACLGGCPTYVPHLDSAFELRVDGAVDVSASAPVPRIDPGAAGHRDWNNDFQILLQDLNDELRHAADDKSRSVIIRRIRRALETPSE